jgi:N-acetylglucosaminyl-diphospho-decaprenol L-rhamnosyltransferase
MARGYEFVLIANADAEVVNPGFLKELVAAARRWPQGAFFGPLVFHREPDVIQKTCLEFPSVWRAIWKWVPWRLARRHFERNPPNECAVQFLNGVCVLCRASALREFGLMDETFGGYMEDADWSWRAREKGWATVFIPIPSVVHHEAASGYEQYSLRSFLLKRNTVYWFLKIGRRSSAWAYACASLALASARLLCAGFSEERRKYRYFLKRANRAFGGLLRGEPLGEWFGPPLGPWDGE